MIQKLTPTEIDLLGDLCQNEHELWEVFGFVRLHEGQVADAAVLQAGIAIIVKFSVEGWLQILKPGNREEITGGELTTLLQSLTSQHTYHLENAPRLVMTELGEKRYYELAK